MLDENLNLYNEMKSRESDMNVGKHNFFFFKCLYKAIDCLKNIWGDLNGSVG